MRWEKGGFEGHVVAPLDSRSIGAYLPILAEKQMPRVSQPFLPQVRRTSLIGKGRRCFPWCRALPAEGRRRRRGTQLKRVTNISSFQRRASMSNWTREPMWLQHRTSYETRLEPSLWRGGVVGGKLNHWTPFLMSCCPGLAKKEAIRRLPTSLSSNPGSRQLTLVMESWQAHGHSRCTRELR